METAVKDNVSILKQQQSAVRQLVMDGLQQVREGKTKNFEAVCDRLEKKYTNARVQGLLHN